MAKIKIHYNGRTPEIIESEEVVSGQLKTIEIQFTFSEEWDMYANRTAVFTSSAATKEWPLNEEGTVRIPRTVICSGVRAMAVSVFGVAQDENGEYQRYNGKLAGFRVEMGGRVPGEGCKDADPSMYEVLLTAIAKKLDAYQGTENAGKAMVVGEDGTVVPGEAKGNVELDTTLTQSGKAADAKAVGDALAALSGTNSELPFTENEISGVASGGGFVVNPTNFADGKTYFRYNAGSTYGFRWTNPNPQKGSLTITVRGYSQYSNTLDTKIVTVYTDGSDNGVTDAMYLRHGETVTYTTDPNKTVDYIRGNYDFENWVLLDMDVLSIVADYPAPTGTVKSVNGILPDENGNVEIPVSDGALVEPAEDDIPKVFFGGALQQTKDEAVVPFRYISKTEDISGYAEIKAQGNSSMSYPKKNQTVKLYKNEACTEKLKIDFKGWGKQSKFCFKANWIDLTHARNVVSARLWGDVVKSRANYEELPELLRTSPNQGAVNGFPIKVYANGVYQGRYTANIPKDAWMANMDDELDNHCILCGENYVSGCFRAAANINGSDWTDEVHDAVPASIKTRWNEVISFVMNSTDEEFKANLGNYFYVDSLIDYYLFGLVSCGLDAFGKNQLYMTYNGQKWIATMYDMDSTWGLWWTGSSFVATDYDRSEYQDFKDGAGNLLFIRLEELFCEAIKIRWEDLKHGALSIENIINRFERFTDIAPAELVKEDYASTTGGGKFTGIPSQSTNNIQQLRSYANARFAWTDEYVENLTSVEEVPCTGITLSAPTLTFVSAGSQTLVATVEPTNTTDTVVWSVDDNSIASVSGGVVRAKANGSCTITAKCGEYSATCAVSVSGIEEGEDVTLPSGYTAVEYIQSDGNQYIDTGVSGGTNAAWEIKMNALGAVATNWEQYICGAKHSTIPNLYLGSNNRIESSNMSGPGNSLNVLDYNDHTYEYRGTKNVYVDGEPYDVVNDPTGNGWGTSTWYVFNSHGEPNLKSSMRLYYFKMWTDGVLVRDFVPAVRNSDNSRGLYDLANNVFYGNIGTGAFLIPDEVEGDTGVKLIYNMPEATTFNGTSDYIDTGVPLMSTAKNMNICIDCDFSDCLNNSTIFHCKEETSPYNGISLAFNDARNYGVVQQSTRMNGIPAGRRKIVIRFVSGCMSYVKYSDGGIIKTIEKGGTYGATDRNLLIGCHLNAQGNKVYFWTGTIYDFKVYEGTMIDSDIAAYLIS